MLMKSHSALCFLSLLRQESRPILHSTALADSGSLDWNCISTADKCPFALCFITLFTPIIASLKYNLEAILTNLACFHHSGIPMVNYST
ncbi:hypothetical protein V6N13_125081 [Hibiscus sabdariffa]